MACQSDDWSREMPRSESVAASDTFSGAGMTVGISPRGPLSKIDSRHVERFSTCPVALVVAGPRHARSLRRIPNPVQNISLVGPGDHEVAALDPATGPGRPFVLWYDGPS